MTLRVIFAALSGVVLFGCQAGEPPDADVDLPPADSGHDARDAGHDGPTDAGAVDGSNEETGEASSLPGPLTHVADELEFIADRLCDLDGDGLLDNAAADLGGSHGALFAATFNSLFGYPDLTRMRWLFHFPWVDDLRAPDDGGTTLILSFGFAWDDGAEPADDFDGDEIFDVSTLANDSCGEPQAAFPETRIDQGVVVTTLESDWLLALSAAGVVLTAERARVSAELTPRVAEGSWEICGMLAIEGLGDAPALEAPEGSDISLLEMLLGGGTSFGVPGLPGIQPDLDLDGDGLERFELGDTGHIEGCIDGDLSPIEGRDCWRDPRMADGFSVNFRFHTVPAQLGRQNDHDGICDVPPETSLWDGR